MTVFFVAILVAISFVGCSKTDLQPSSSDVEIIVEEIITEGGNEVSSIDNPNSNVLQNNSSIASNVSSEQPATSSSQTDQTSDTANINYEWKTHAQDYKLLAFTFDDGPSPNMHRFAQLFSWYEGAGTFFVTGSSVGQNGYQTMQSAINLGWDIGNHGDNHLVAANGGNGGGEATYDQIKADITNLTAKLEGNLKTRDGAPYKVNFYRPPNIKPTANTFKVCTEQNLAIIWLKHDALDWDKTKTYNDRYNVFKNGIGTWNDGDIILCHETGLFSDDTYNILEKLLPDFYRAGYRFCSISDLMQMRGITQSQISGQLKNYDNNNGMVKNVVQAAQQGKK